MDPIVVILILVLILAVVVIANIKIVPQSYVYVVERLGAYHASWGTGVHVMIPFIDKIAKRVNLKEQVIDFPPQDVITKDNVTMKIDTVIFFMITNAMQFTYLSLIHI